MENIIDIEVEWDSEIEIEWDKIKIIITNTITYSLVYEKVEFPCEISVFLTNNATIKELNRKFRNINKVTDVLSFPNEMLPNEDENCCLGDIIISVEKALGQADEYGHSIEREIAFLTAHSVLHLLGYDHMNNKDEKIMFEKQEEILIKMGLTRI